MLIVRDFSFFSVGRLLLIFILFIMFSLWVRCFFSLDVFGLFFLIFVFVNIKLVYYYRYFDCLIIFILINLIYLNL